MSYQDIYQCLQCERKFTLDECYMYHFPLHQNDRGQLCRYSGKDIFDSSYSTTVTLT